MQCSGTRLDPFLKLSPHLKENYSTHWKSTLRFSRGEPKYHQTSHFAERGFCPDCGSRLIYRPLLPELPEWWVNLPVGSLDHPEKAVPASHVCVESQLPWYKLDDGLPRTRTEDDPELAALWSAQDK